MRYPTLRWSRREAACLSLELARRELRAASRAFVFSSSALCWAPQPIAAWIAEATLS